VSRQSPSVPPLPPLLELSASRAPRDTDPELAALPKPPRLGKAVAMAALAAGALAAFAMAFALRRDVAYVFAGAAAEPLGDLRIAPRSVLASHDNRFVRADGLLEAARGIRYGRPLRGDTFRAMPVLGRPAGEGVWVEVRAPAIAPANEETGQWEPPRAFVGRLVAFDAADLGHSGLGKAIESATRAHVGRGAFLLIDGEEPAHERWTLVLAVVFIALAVWNSLAFARLVRRVR
jgi:hypothetical protein